MSYDFLGLALYVVSLGLVWVSFNRPKIKEIGCINAGAIFSCLFSGIAASSAVVNYFFIAHGGNESDMAYAIYTLLFLFFAIFYFVMNLGSEED